MDTYWLPDCDGVLNSTMSESPSFNPPCQGVTIIQDADRVWCHRHFRHLGPFLLVLEKARVAVARDLVDATGAAVVLSSSWRQLIELEGLAQMLAVAGWPQAPLVDRTPIYSEIIDGPSAHRADEVDAWVRQRARRPEPFRWLALDDAWPEQAPKTHVVEIDPAVGLTEADAACARDRLGRGLREVAE